MRGESQLSEVLCALLRKEHFFVQRIESAETTRGIPDLYVRTKQREWWIELKNMKHITINQQLWTIPWRPGQQSWPIQYARASGQYTVTFCALRDGFLWIPMLRRWKDNVVPSSEVIKLPELKDILVCLR